MFPFKVLLQPVHPSSMIPYLKDDFVLDPPTLVNYSYIPTAHFAVPSVSPMPQLIPLQVYWVKKRWAGTSSRKRVNDGKPLIKVSL